MPEDTPRPAQPAIRTDLGAIFVSMELSCKTWLITSLSPGGGEKMSKHLVPAGDVSGLLRRFAELRRKAAARTGRDFPIIVIQEAGLDGFWIHRVLQSEGIESHVVDARLRRSGADAMAERLDRSRAGRVQGGQPAAEDNHGRAGLAMAAEPADLGAQPVVPRAGPAPRRADAQDDHRRPGAQAPHRPVAVHHRRRCHRGGRDEGGAGDDLTPPART